jgi:YbgC/YbaW family acyl-CoA thioester hydrolase
MSEEIPFRYQTRVRFIDTDASTRIHYTAMFRYFEAAEIEFLRSLGITYEVSAGLTFPRVHVECDYYLALRHDDLLDIEVRIGAIGRSSVRFEYTAFRERERVARGAIVIACVDTSRGRSIPIPDELRVKLAPAFTEAEAR